MGLADLDGDGDLDVATANRFGADLSVLLSDGTGSLAAPLSLPIEKEGVIVDLAIADVNGDQRADLVTQATNYGSVYAALNTTPTEPPVLVGTNPSRRPTTTRPS